MTPERWQHIKEVFASALERVAAERHPQTNGICERFHRTMLDEFYRVAFRKKVYSSIEELQVDVDVWLREYNEERTHTGKYGTVNLNTF